MVKWWHGGWGGYIVRGCGAAGRICMIPPISGRTASATGWADCEKVSKAVGAMLWCGEKLLYAYPLSGVVDYCKARHQVGPYNRRPLVKNICF